MKYYAMLLLLPFIFCGSTKKVETKVSLDSIEPKMLYESFTPDEKEFLQKFGFFARKSPQKKFSELYKLLKSSSLPIYITTDCILHTYHILYDYSLRILELNYLYKDLTSLTETMINETKKLSTKTSGDIKEAILANLAYFEVAYKLLNPEFIPSKETEKEVYQELDLIISAKDFAVSPIFGYKEDYSQYKPRGHYTRNETFQRYFRAMMWYGRMTFRLKPDKNGNNKKGSEETRRALLILEPVKEYFKRWKKINDPIILYVGKSDDLTILEYLDIKNRLFPNEEPITIASDNSKLQTFINEALKYRPPKILSGLVMDTAQFETITKGMRFFGQKFIPDSYIFQNLVYDKVGTRDNPRLFPKGLDVFAVFGSPRAYDILIEKYKENRFLNYESQMKKLTDEFRNLKEEDWFFNLYYGWLYTLKSLLLPVPGFQPAYQDKCLQTALGSWAELRHDTILYAKQSYTVGITAIPPQPKMVQGYVEPIPECFRRMRKLVDMSRIELANQASLDEGVKYKLEEFARLLSELQRIAEYEIENRPLTADDYHFIQNIGSTLENLESFPGAEYTTETDESAALIADVHTDPNTKQVLEIGNDLPAFIYTIVGVGGIPQIFVGGIYDYYEFLQPITTRLTDEEWQKLSPKPAKPDWIEFFR